MKRVDIRDVYVCTIVKQGEPRLRRSVFDTNFQDVSLFSGYVWDYEGEGKSVLCVRTFGGWKRLGTEEFYPFASKKNAGKMVVPKSRVKELQRCAPDMIENLLSHYKTYYLPMDIVKSMEDRVCRQTSSRLDGARTM